MRHLKRGRKLNRNASHRRALLRNLAAVLVAQERITTTVAKAKELRPFVERLITLARRGSLHARRLVMARLGGKKTIAHKPDGKKDTIEVDVVRKLFDELGPRYVQRPGGYTRILKLTKHRVGDGAPLAVIELVREEMRTTAPAPVEPKVAPSA
ncbi:MAG: 50S ribosomal protein L17 [Gemmataceae bacterium]